MDSQSVQLKKILFCTDFSDNARAAFEAALKVAAMNPGSELTLLHVLPEPDAQFWKTYIYEVEGDVDEKARKALDEAVEKDYRPLVPAGIVFNAAFRIGKAHVKILEFADEIGAELIIIGRQGQDAWTNLFFGSVATRIVERASCPVLVIPPRNNSDKQK